jgi:hypothetical protein
MRGSRTHEAYRAVMGWFLAALHTQTLTTETVSDTYPTEWTSANRQLRAMVQVIREEPL